METNKQIYDLNAYLNARKQKNTKLEESAEAINQKFESEYSPALLEESVRKYLFEKGFKPLEKPSGIKKALFSFFDWHKYGILFDKNKSFWHPDKKLIFIIRKEKTMPAEWNFHYINSLKEEGSYYRSFTNALEKLVEICEGSEK